MLSYRQKLWLKLSWQALRGYLREPRPEAWQRFRHALAAHPFSSRVRGGGALLERDNLGRPLRLTILLTPCCWDEYTIPMVQLGRALERRGFEVSWLGGAAGGCSFFGTAGGDWSHERCLERFKVLEKVILGQAGSFHALNDRVTAEACQAAEEWFAQCGGEPVLTLTYDGWRVWDLIKGTASYGRQRSERVPMGPEETAASREGLPSLLKSFVISYETIRAYLSAERPDAVMIFNGLFYQERIMSELARRQGIRVVAHENSSFSDRKIFDTTGYIGNYTSVAARTWPSVRARVLDEAQRRRLAEYLQGVYGGRHNTIGQAPPAAAAEIRRQLGLAEDARLALLIGQVPCDTVMIYDLHSFDSSLAFIRRTIEIFRGMPEWTLIVRLHPQEADKFGDVTYGQLREGELPANVRLVHGRELNTYSLMALAEFGVTATSQAGLEMLSMGKPLVVVGEAFYAHKGFTADVPNAGLYEPALRQVAADPRLTPAQQGLIESFLYHVIFEHQIPYDRANALFPPEALDRIEALLRGR